MEKINILISNESIQKKIIEIAKAIINDHEHLDQIHFVVVLEGAKIFAKALTDEINKSKKLKINTCFIKLESYGDKTESAGKINVLKDLENDISGKSILVVEDIVDTGLTLHFLEKYLVNKKGAHSVKNCVLLNKPVTRKFNVPISYCGFPISDRFVIGYGLDYKGLYRDLDYIGHLS
jgi:hypoxanthine phosphoribosyltransferase